MPLFTTKIFEIFKTYSKIPFEGESVGYTVKSMEKDFPISNYPLEQTEFLYDSKQGKVIKEMKPSGNYPISWAYLMAYLANVFLTKDFCKTKSVV